MPDHLSHDSDNPIEGRSARWPRGVPGYRDDLPEDMETGVMAYALVLEIVADADDILIAVEPNADQRLLGAIDVALEVPGCYVIEVAPHPEGAAGIMRQHVEDVLRDSPMPPGM